MELKRITSTNHPMYKIENELYKISFPFHEQRENLSQKEILNNPNYHFDIITHNNDFISEILYWEINNFYYIEHFCISPEKRSNHYGEKALNLLKNKSLILEIDPPNDSISKRRQGFYERCGFKKNSYNHIHPPYHKENPGHKLTIMSCPCELTQKEYNIFNDFLIKTVMKNAYC